ncbi:MAG: hypothetical protein AAF917_12860 [Pseudomonadota bacterium]
MTDFEQATLFFQIIDTAHSAVANFLTVVFAVVAVSYFVAERLDRSVSLLLLGVYSLFCIGMIREIFYLYSDMARLGHAMAQEPSDAFDWLNIAQNSVNNPETVIPYSVLTMTGLAFAGSLLFFYRMRRSARAETS